MNHRIFLIVLFDVYQWNHNTYKEKKHTLEALEQ